MKCPCCSTVDLVMSERTGIEIDYCPQCRGVWLDRGELDKIIERSARLEVVPPPPMQSNPLPQHGDQYWGHAEHHGHHGQSRHEPSRHHGKKSIWQEIFD